MIEIQAEAERLVPPATWVHENSRVRVLQRPGGPRLTCTDSMGNWLKRHQTRLNEYVALVRMGDADQRKPIDEVGK